MKFYPALLSDSVDEIQKQLSIAQSLESVEVVQIDVIDGQYADNMTVTPLDLVDLDFHNLKIDFHLMVEEPINYVSEIIQCEEQLPVRAVIAQIERLSHQAEVLSELKKNKIQAGLSLDLFTPIESIDLSSASDIDLIQLMGVEAGFQGQSLHQSVFKKIADLMQWLKTYDLSAEVVVDGGVKLDNILLFKQAGVDAVAVGSLLWTAKEPSQIAKQIQQI
jgi:ribulose-phosphate 3-epimerase